MGIGAAAVGAAGAGVMATAVGATPEVAVEATAEEAADTVELQGPAQTIAALEAPSPQAVMVGEGLPSTDLRIQDRKPWMVDLRRP
jgi:predicted aconitase